MIFAYLPRTDLRCVSFCSKKFYVLSVPVLYRVITLPPDRILFLVRSIHKNHKLAEHIKDVRIEGVGRKRQFPGPVGEEHLNPPKLPEDRSLCQTSERNEWTWLASLLCRLVKIVHFEWHFTARLGETGADVTDMMRAAASKNWLLSKFTSLSSVKLKMDDERHIDLDAILHLPSLANLQIDNLLAIPRKTLTRSRLRCLEIKHSARLLLSPVHLEPILAACPSLHEFRLYTDTFSCGSFTHGSFVVQNIQKLPKKLRILVLDLPVTTYPTSPYLGRFLQLSTLQIPQQMIVVQTPSSRQEEFHQLPRSLQDLTLSVRNRTGKFKNRLFSHLLEFVQNPLLSPDLVRLTLLWPSDLGKCEELSMACSRRGISLISRVAQAHREDVTGDTSSR